MARGTLTVSPEDEAVLKEAVEIKGDGVVIVQQLDRKQYVRVNKLLEAAGCKWNRSKRMHLFQSTEAKTKMEGLLATGQVVDDKKAYDFYRTPDHVVDTMLQMLGLFTADLSGMLFLEPSAGDGAIVRKLLKQGAKVDCIEIHRERAQGLLRDFGKSGVVCRCDDFLDVVSPQDSHREAAYDFIVMNPPFRNGVDIKHVEHAKGWLKPGGRLASVVPNGPRQIEHYTNGRGFDGYHVLPNGSFRCEGTQVNTAIVTWTKKG